MTSQSLVLGTGRLRVMYTKSTETTMLADTPRRIPSDSVGRLIDACGIVPAAAPGAWRSTQRGNGTYMKRILSLALIYPLLCAPLAGRQVQGQTSGVITGAVSQCTGVISGSVTSQIGRPLSGITMQLLDSSGAVVGKAVTARNGEFSMPGVSCGTDTLQCLDKDKVIGTSSVTLTGASESVRMTCTTDVVPFWKTKLGVLTVLGAAATAIGATAVVSTGADASAAR